MKISKASTLVSNTASEPMGMDAESFAIMAQILSAGYTHAEEAVIREYVSNGLDATTAAGVNTEVEVTLPTHLTPELTITDHGIGMSPHQARHLFAVYVSSSKRDSDEPIGGLGIGSKSGFAVSSMISVNTVKDGERTELSVAWDEAGPQVISNRVSDTDAANGTRVTLPVDPNHDWVTAARTATQYMAGRVLIDGEPVTDPRGANPSTVMLAPRSQQRNHQVVMGGPAYSLPESLEHIVTRHVATLGFRAHDHKMVIEVPLGTLSVNPYREWIKATDENTEALDAYLAEKFSGPLNETFLGETPWETFRAMTDAPDANRDGSTLVSRQVYEHLSAVRRDMTQVRGSEQVAPLAFSLDPNTLRRCVHDGKKSGRTVVAEMVTHQLFASSPMQFVHAPQSISSSPKIRRWLLDRADTGATLVVVPQEGVAQNMRAAGIEVWSQEQLREYKPTTKPAPGKSQARYQVRGPGDFHSVELTGAEIEERFDAVVMARYSSLGRQFGLMTTLTGHARIGLVALSASHSPDLFRQRVGDTTVYTGREMAELISASHHQLIGEGNAECLVRLGSLINDSWINRYRNPAMTESQLRRIAVTGIETRDFYTNMVTARTVLAEVSEFTGIKLPGAITDALQAYDHARDTSWILPMLGRISAAGADIDTVLSSADSTFTLFTEEHSALKQSWGKLVGAEGSYRYQNTDLHGEAGKMLVSEAFRTKNAQNG